MKQYRVSFFNQLRESLAEQGIELTVVYGTPWEAEARRGDHAEIPSPFGLKVRNHILFGKLFFQPVWTAWWRADLVIVEQANKHLLNYLLLCLQALGLKRVAFWGHGRDKQRDARSWGERFKRAAAHRVYWWFAYTKSVADYLQALRFPASRITIVENAVDTLGLRDHLASVSAESLGYLRDSLGLLPQHRVAVYCGSLYQSKRLDFLLAAATRVHDSLETFRLVMIGGGPLEQEMLAFSEHHPWLHVVGPQFGAQKAHYLRLGELLLNPGLVGLGILDAFCAELPIITTDLPIHSPEIDYLESGSNGLMVRFDEKEYADVVLDTLNDPPRLAALQQNAFESSMRYTMENMVRNFSEGVVQCLSKS